MNLSVAEKIYLEIKNLENHDYSYGLLENKKSQNESAELILNAFATDLPEREIQRLHQEFFGLGPIDNLINDEGVTEILILAPDQIWIERGGKLERSQDYFLNPITYNNCLKKLSERAETHTSFEKPTSNGEYFGHRIHYVTKFLTKNFDQVTIRKHPKNSWTLSRFLETKWAEESEIAAVQKIVKDKESFLVVGPTGVGKTSVLNACLHQVAENERTVIIEDCSELMKPNPLSTKLLTRTDAYNLNQEINQGHLVKEALRMRPDRIVMGEVRGGEAKDLLMALATGHSGSMGSLHADSARQALIRLEMLIQLGAPNWSLNAIRNLIFLSLQKIIVVGRNKNGDRHLEGIYRLSSIEESGILIEKTN